MNAAEQAKDFILTNKIAATVNLFKGKYPAARADLKPWLNHPDVMDWLDPDSIDVGFHFPGVSRMLKVRSILCQIRLYQDPVENKRRAIGIEASGHDYRGQRWRFSTIDNWEFTGDTTPLPEAVTEIRDFCRQAIDLFNSNTSPFLEEHSS